MILLVHVTFFFYDKFLRRRSTDGPVILHTRRRCSFKGLSPMGDCTMYIFRYASRQKQRILASKTPIATLALHLFQI